MIQIRILSKDRDEVMEWEQYVVGMANSYTDARQITFSGAWGGEGGYEVYITVITGEPAEEQAQTVIRSAPVDPGAGDVIRQFRQVDIYTALGQLWGLAE